METSDCSRPFMVGCSLIVMRSVLRKRGGGVRVTVTVEDRIRLGVRLG